MDYLQLTNKEKYTIVQINRPRANAINAQMVDEIRSTFKELEADDEVKGIILTGIPKFFSAGLDLIELINYDHDQMRAFFINFSMMHYELARIKKPFICAITGHCPAGGTVIAIAADHRVMADNEKFTIGLNEVAVNIQISSALIEAYTFWIGRSLAYRYVMAGKLLTPSEALAANLVDEVVPMEEVLPRAEKKMKQYLQSDFTILTTTKARLRSPWLDSIDLKKAEGELQTVMDIWWSPEVRAKMQMFVEFLKSRSKSKVS